MVEQLHRATSILIGSIMLAAVAASILGTGAARQYPTLPICLIPRARNTAVEYSGEAGVCRLLQICKSLVLVVISLKNRKA